MKKVRAMNNPIEDQGKDILVSAGAGTGKTFTLKKRVAFELSHHYTDLRRMLILTFTNAAAASMRNKIALELKEFVKGDEATEDERKTIQEQLKYIQNADIVTFDSFNNSLVKKYFYRIPGFRKDFSILTGGVLNQVLYDIIDDILEENYKNPSPVFKQFMDRYTFVDDDKVRALIKKGIDIAQSRADPIAYLDEMIADALNISSAVKDTEDRYEQAMLAEVKKAGKEYLEFIRDYLPGDSHYAKVYEAYASNPSAFNLNGSVEEIENSFHPLTSPRGTNTKASENYKAYTAAKGKFNDAIKAGKRAPIAREYAEKYHLAQGPYRELLYKMMKEAYVRFQAFKKEKNIYDFGDINHFALDLLKNDSFVRGEVAASYDEIMVDEYQDNNDLQETFISLIKQDPNFKGTLFMVGDVKQSIYGFRNAEPKNFVRRFNRYKQGLDNGELCTLLKNFRSAPNVLDYVNKTFSILMTEDFGGIDYANDHKIDAGKKSYLKVKQKTRVITYSQEGGKASGKREAEIIADDILTRIENHETVTLLDENNNPYEKGLDFGSFALIADRGGTFSDVAKVFKEKGIPLTVQQDEEEQGSTIIALLKNLIILGVSIALMKDGKEEETFKKDEFVHAYLSLARGPYQYKEDRLNDLFSCYHKRDFSQDKIYLDIKETVSKCRGNTISYFYDKLCKECKVLKWVKALPESSSDYRFFLSFSAIIDNLTTMGYSWKEAMDFIISSRFDDDLQSKFSINTASTSKSVTLINMHKSKGLQYPICYFYQLSKGYNEQDTRSTFTMYKDTGIFLPFVEQDPDDTTYAKLMGGASKAHYNWIKKACDYFYIRSDREENIRKLYVALTRAEYQINIIRFEDNEYKEKDLSEYTRFQDLLDYVDKQCPGLIYDSNRITIQESDTFTKKAQRDVALTPEKFSYQDREIKEEQYGKVHTTASKGEADSSTISTAALEFGSRVHEALQATDFHSKDVSFILEKKIQDMVLSFLNSSFYQQYKDYDIYKEYHYLDDNKEGSVDLLLLSEKKAIIIDYKLKHIDDADYDKQLNIYRSQIQHLFPEKEVECYLYAITTSEIKKVEE